MITLDRRSRQWLTAALLLAVLIVSWFLPSWLDTYNQGRVDTVLFYLIAVLSMNLVTGMTGQISLGQGAFYGVGAYGVSILVGHLGWPYWGAIPASVVIAGLAGIVVGIPAARIRGLYLAITTLAVGLVFPEIVQKFESVTGGSNGATLTRYLTSPVQSISDNRWVFYLTVVLALLVIVMVRNLLHSSFGRAMLASRDHPAVAELFAVRVTQVRILAFGISAALAGMAGALFVTQEQFAAPSDFTFTTSLNFFVGMAIGGAVSVYGAILGALFLEFAPSLITGVGVGQWAVPIVYGAVLVLLVYFLPNGASGGLNGLARRFVRRTPTVSEVRVDNTETPAALADLARHP